MNSVNLQTEIATTKHIVNNEAQIYNSIMNSTTKKDQLMKAAKEFESIFITKMLSTMDKTVDKENGIFGGEGMFLKNFKSYMYMEMGREMSKNPMQSFGFAKQIYEQMEKHV